MLYKHKLVCLWVYVYSDLSELLLETGHVLQNESKVFLESLEKVRRSSWGHPASLFSTMWGRGLVLVVHVAQQYVLFLFVRWHFKFGTMSSKKNQGGDERFLRVQKDPRFWEMPEKERKIKIDKRFQSMFHDKRFKVKYTVDKRGRPINHTSTEDLKRFYKLSDSEDEDDEEDVKSKKMAEGKKKKKVKEKLVKADGEVKKGKTVQSRDGEAEAERPERGVRVVEEGESMSSQRLRKKKNLI